MTMSLVWDYYIDSVRSLFVP